MNDAATPRRYIQFLAYEDGSVLAEVVSNGFLDDEERWTKDQEQQWVADWLNTTTEEPRRQRPLHQAFEMDFWFDRHGESMPPNSEGVGLDWRSAGCECREPVVSTHKEPTWVIKRDLKRLLHGQEHVHHIYEV